MNLIELGLLDDRGESKLEYLPTSVWRTNELLLILHTSQRIIRI